MILQYTSNLHKFFGDRMIHIGTINTMKEMGSTLTAVEASPWGGVSSMQLRKLEFDEYESLCIIHVNPRSLDGILGLASR